MDQQINKFINFIKQNNMDLIQYLHWDDIWSLTQACTSTQWLRKNKQFAKKARKIYQRDRMICKPNNAFKRTSKYNIQYKYSIATENRYKPDEEFRYLSDSCSEWGDDRCRHWDNYILTTNLHEVDLKKIIGCEYKDKNKLQHTTRSFINIKNKFEHWTVKHPWVDYNVSPTNTTKITRSTWCVLPFGV